MIIHVENVEQFQKEIASGTVLVDFYADWCGPCQMLAPLLEDLSKQENVKILKINVDDLGDIARAFRIMSIPTLIVFKGGQPVKREMGYMPLERLKALVS